jgi:hypothetical protein
LCYFLVQHAVASDRRRPPTAVPSGYLLRNSTLDLVNSPYRETLLMRDKIAYNDNAFTWPVLTVGVVGLTPKHSNRYQPISSR